MCVCCLWAFYVCVCCGCCALGALCLSLGESVLYCVRVVRSVCVHVCVSVVLFCFVVVLCGACRAFCVFSILLRAYVVTFMCVACTVQVPRLV